MLSPTEYFEEHLIPATNQELLRDHDKELTLGEFYCWLGVWFIISLNLGYNSKEFFFTKRKKCIGILHLSEVLCQARGSQKSVSVLDLITIHYQAIEIDFLGSVN